MKRLFTFGCSFTRYNWPTWADVMSQEFDEYQNWAQRGAGGHFVLYSLMECMVRNKMSANDTVGIMWPEIDREDRYLRGSWKLMGSVHNTPVLKELVPKYIDNLTDPTGYLLTSISVMHAVKNILDSIGCKYYFFSWAPLGETDHYSNYWFNRFISHGDIDKDIRFLYKETLSTLKPSVYEVIFNNDWNSRNHHANIKYCKDHISEQWDKIKGPDWPNLDTYINKQWDTYPKWLIDELTERGFMPNINARFDPHPTPAEHFEYLSKVGIDLTEKQKQYAEYWDNIVINGDIDPYRNTLYNQSIPKRF